ncbi:type III polyketide synthase [Nakamurella silvestris]|nr:type III polyketide synthase [Nakamurella silvestris]
MTTLAAVHGVVPPFRYPQDAITDAFAEVCLGPGANTEVLRRIHGNTRVKARHLALPLERYRELADFTEANNAYIEIAVDLGAQALLGALESCGLTGSDVDVVIFTTVTGVAAPSIDARFASRVGLRPDVKRMPLFGLGCVAGAAGIGRLSDYLVGHPDQVAVLVSVELCSLTVQRNDRSVANLVASGLFGDGAAAVVAVGSRHRLAGTGPVVLDSVSHLYPDTERTMGWDVGSSGLNIVLDAHVPELVQQYLGVDVRTFLAAHELTVEDVGAWVSHPGGPKVIEAIEDELALPPAALEMTWRSLAEVGNLSSSSVLHVLHDTLAERPPTRGTPGLLLAMGPGFCSELVLLRW